MSYLEIRLVVMVTKNFLEEVLVQFVLVIVQKLVTSKVLLK